MKKNLIFTIILTVIAMVSPINSLAVTESQLVRETKALFEEFDKIMVIFVVASHENEINAAGEALLAADDIGSKITKNQRKRSRAEKEQIERWLETKRKQTPGFQKRRDIFNKMVNMLNELHEH